MSAPARAHWTKLNVVLHWLIVVLLVVQYLVSESMEGLWDATTEGKLLTPETHFYGWVHIITGSVVLVAAALRLADRLRNGRPPHSAVEPHWALLLSKVTHAAMYAVLILMPALGLAAWLSGIDGLAQLHTLLWTPLLVLIGLHVVGALAQQFYFRTNAIGRMTQLR